MKFLADENFDAPAIMALRLEGYDVLSIKEILPKALDKAILELANKENRILLTCDKDFGELVYRLKLISPGIVLFRLAEMSNAEKVRFIVAFMNQYSDKLPKSFSVVTPRKVRVLGIF